MKKFIVLIFFFGLISCTENKEGKESEEKESVWILDCKSDDPSSCGFKNLAGEIKIAHDKYPMIFTDTLDNYAIVLKNDVGFVAIDKKENTLYTIYTYDNGPDYPKDGYFRIIENGKIGYANKETGAVEIAPKYIAARPFENGYAAICPECELKKELEYTTWANGKWGLIDKKGTVVLAPAFDDIQSVSKDGMVYVTDNGESKTIELKK